MSTPSKIVTRFAPSPTGFLHIGGARTALFNWLYARKMGGEFRLRIEDTDRARSTPEATQAILDGMAWLGLGHDGDIVYQHSRASNHVAAAQSLLESGAAYRCFCTPEELEVLRAQARNEGHAFRSPWRDKSASDRPSDTPFTVRFRVPEGMTTIHDQVQGQITWQNKEFDDLVLLRADGTPTYMLAVVVDDHNMDVTHVIRGDDHLINAGRQSQIYMALGWDIPVFAHVPLIHGPDGKKLSKRHGALGVEAYKEMGYLPDGLRNYLLKLGWSKGDQDVYLGQTATEAFDLKGINSAAARLDFDKMDYINGQHILEMDDAELLSLVLPFIEAVHGSISETLNAKLLAAMPSLKPRSSTLKQIVEQAAYLLAQRPLSITGKTKKSLKADRLPLLESLTNRLKSLEGTAWTEDNLLREITDFVAEHEIGFGKIGQPARAALTAGSPSPDLALVFALLGKDEALGRLGDVITVQTG
ncbi:MAG: glutamate--tRNA ligase [Maricaulaceae bacterium]